MKRRICYSALLLFALPILVVMAEDAVIPYDHGLNSLEEITRKMDDAPALLFLTPSQLDAVEYPIPKSSKPASNKPNSLAISAYERESGRIRQIKTQQAKINILKAKVTTQEAALYQLRKVQSQFAGSSVELVRLQHAIEQIKRENVRLQQQLAVQAKERERQMQQKQERRNSSQLSQELAAQIKDSVKKAQQVIQQQQTLSQNQEVIAKIREQLAAKTKDSEQKNEQVKQLQQASSKLKAQQLAQLQLHQQELLKLHAQLAAQEKDSEQKMQQLKQFQEQLAAASKENEQKAQQVEKLQQELPKLQEQLSAHTKDNNQKVQELAKLQQKLIAAEEKQTVGMSFIKEPKTQVEKRDYAIGTALGNDILDLLNTKKTRGVDVNLQIALAGVADVINGKTKLAQEQIAKALYESELELKNQHEKIKQRNEKQGRNYIDKFKQQPHVVQSKKGFYYLIDYVGDSIIGEGDTVAVVVKESLIDGKVIKDMDVAGTTISQPLSAYPPLFREALGKLKNHGNMTLVVPPELAYGDKGMEPDIPPGATMVYNVRILDVIPTSQQKDP
ncbi:FKBP-type peptidyl-prolyl cis-trans isomerase N-terminal domain-containing protein [Enterobacter sp. 262D3]|uniref:FKBP-type peptidyl-prolyl cis-trans isomerase N-terminal domain-containing protein n=1 Tax=Enterobacter sp. 262D3 TaxID=3077763 RepID=UPI002A7EC618|nr:FKBP-type peptidyl-prolyl cis-trans isomerase N-terminal domain-containing protein [Enterobacter sp. 262D3]